MWIITLIYGNRVDSWQSENPEEDLKAVSWSGTLKSVTVELAPAYKAWKHAFTGKPWNTPHFTQEQLDAVRRELGVTQEVS